MPGPGLESPVDKDWDGGGVAPSAQQAEAGLEGGDFSIARASAFREQTYAVSLLQLADDDSHRGEVCFASFDRDSLDGDKQLSEEAAEERIAGEKIHGPLDEYAAEDGVEEALMVTNKHQGAIVGDILLPFRVQPEKGLAENLAQPSRKTGPSHFRQSVFFQ